MPAASASSSSRRIDDISTDLNLSCSLSSFPAASISGTMQNDSPQAASGPAPPTEALSDPSPIQRRLLGSPAAEKHFAFYQRKLDPLIHYVLTDKESLPLLRNRSEFLAIAVCTVAACCAGTSDHNEWLDLYKILVSARTFARQHAFDDVRALCIGAFWLTQLATALNALGMTASFLVCIFG